MRLPLKLSVALAGLSILPALFATHVEAGGVAIECTRLLNGTPTKQNFDLGSFISKLNAAAFSDKNGDAFHFKPVSPVDVSSQEAHFWLDVEHSRYGLIRQAQQHQDPRSSWWITATGDIVGDHSYVDYGEYKSCGFLGRLFEFFAATLPNGSRFTISDASATADVERKLTALPVATIRRFAADDVVGRQLFALYRELVLAGPQSAPERLLLRLRLSSDRNLIGFRRYLSDLYSIWGRVARKGGYRHDYFSHRVSPYREYVKRTVPPAIVEAEDALLSSEAGARLPILEEK